MEIDWGFPAKSFGVSVSVDGKTFTEVFSTDVNILKQSRVQLTSRAAAIRIVMREVRVCF